MTGNLKKISGATPEETRKRGVTFVHGDCNNRVLHGAMEKLNDFTDWSSPAEMSRFNKIANAYESKSKEVGRSFQKLVRKHAELEPVMNKEADGKEVPVLKSNGKPELKPVMRPTGRGRMDFAFKNRKAFNKDYALLMNEEFTVEAYRLLTEDLVKAGCTPREIRACTKFLHDGDDDFIQAPEPYDSEDEDEEEDQPLEGENSDAAASEAPGVPNVSGDQSTSSEPTV